MKKFIYLTLIITCNFFSAQVGINTNTPTRTLDVNGNLHVNTLLQKSDDSLYNKVLSTNDMGEIDHWQKQEIINKMTDGVLENKLMYFSNAPSGNVIVPCGRFDLRFSNNSIPQIRLNKTPHNNTTIYYSRIRRIQGNGNSFGENGRSLVTNSTVNLTRINNEKSDGWQDIGASYSVNYMDEYYISFPNLPNTYRITFLARTMTQPDKIEKNSYTMICEKF